jgi:pyruvate formate lyase activating enzyme
MSVASAGGIIFDIREMTVHDGPGIRTTVFFKGCPLRCAWCHNPEGISFDPEVMVRTNGCRHCGLCTRGCSHPECAGLGRCVKVCPGGLIRKAGERVDAASLADRLLVNGDILDDAGGGFTVSGGEPLAQPDFLFELIDRLKPHHVVVETSGFASASVFTRAAELADLILLDIKHMDPVAHLRGTGVDNRPILENLGGLVASGRSFVARVPVIPGFNDSRENFCAVAERLEPAGDRVRVELLPYNPLAGAKYSMLGRAYSGKAFDGKKPRLDLEPFVRRGVAAVIL